MKQNKLKGFLRREVCNVGTIDWMFPYPQLETHMNSVIMTGYSVLPMNIRPIKQYVLRIMSKSGCLKCVTIRCFMLSLQRIADTNNSHFTVTGYVAFFSVNVAGSSCKLLTGILLWFVCSLVTSRSWIFSL